MEPLGEVLIDRSRMGVIELNADHSIHQCHGTLVNWLPVGDHAVEAISFLIGLNDVLDDVLNGRRSSFFLPRIACHEGPLDGKVVSFEITSAAAKNGLQILVRDETELASLEQSVLQQRNELALANEALTDAKSRIEAALREKSSFLAKISHDLKTPLQVIMGNAEILRGDLPKSERDAFLHDILDNSNFLLALITDLLDASALEADQMKLIEDVVDVRALLERLLLTARQLPDGDRRRFELSIDDDHQILADPMRLQRLLLNLIVNAVNYTKDDGYVRINAARIETGEFVIDIDDDGCGIEPKLMEQVFEPFAMGTGSQGSGLGLHIAKGLADLHGADLTLSSEPGAGTRATLRLPKSRVLMTSS